MINIQDIAQKLVDELTEQSRDSEMRRQGVVLLYDRLVDAAERENENSKSNGSTQAAE